MKKLVQIIIVSFGVLQITHAQDVFDAEEYRFQMNVPEGFEFETFEEDGFGVMRGIEEESQTSLLAYAYIGETNRQKIYDFGVAKTGIPADYWETYGSGKNENGFAWWEMYSASKGGQTLYAVLGKNGNADIYYLFFVLAPDTSFVLYASDYEAWLESCRAK